MFHASDSLFILGKEKSLADEQGHVTNFLPRMISGGDVGPSDSLTSLTLAIAHGDALGEGLSIALGPD